MKLTVKKDFRLPEPDLDTREGRSLWALGGAIYIKGDAIDVSDAEGAALLELFPDVFGKPKAAE